MERDDGGVFRARAAELMRLTNKADLGEALEEALVMVQGPRQVIAYTLGLLEGSAFAAGRTVLEMADELRDG